MSLYALNLLQKPREKRLFSPTLPQKPGHGPHPRVRLFLGRNANLALSLAAGLALLSIPVAPLTIVAQKASPSPPRPVWQEMTPLYARFDLPSPEFGAAKTNFIALRQRVGHGLIERLNYRLAVKSGAVLGANRLELSVITGISAHHAAPLDQRDQNPLTHIAQPRMIATAFGPMSVAQTAQGCWAFHLRHDKPGLLVNGSACPTVGARSFDAGTLACVIGRLDYIGSSHHPALTRYFARAQVRRDEFCHNGHYQPALSTAALSSGAP